MSDRVHPPTDDQPVDSSARSDPHGHTRRAVLRAAGLAALAGGGAAALAACSSDAGTAAPAASSAATPSAGAGSSAPAASASGSASASASAASGPASVAVADVPVGGGVILKDANYVITQPTKGEFKAFSKICTHRGCPVAEVVKTINCKCHGSKFSIEDGSVVNPPASKPLAESPVTVSGDKVTVST